MLLGVPENEQSTAFVWLALPSLYSGVCCVLAAFWVYLGCIIQKSEDDIFIPYEKSFFLSL